MATQLLFGEAMQPLLERWSPPQPQESLLPRYLYDQAIDDPETAVTLVDREQARIFALLPLYVGLDDHLGDDAGRLRSDAVLPAAQALGRSVADSSPISPIPARSAGVLEMISERQARNSLVLSIHEAMADLAMQLARPFESPALRELADNLREGFGCAAADGRGSGAHSRSRRYRLDAASSPPTATVSSIS